MSERFSESLHRNSDVTENARRYFLFERDVLKIDSYAQSDSLIQLL